jgi:hypothetical protein
VVPERGQPTTKTNGFRPICTAGSLTQQSLPQVDTTHLEGSAAHSESGNRSGLAAWRIPFPNHTALYWHTTLQLPGTRKTSRKDMSRHGRGPETRGGDQSWHGGERPPPLIAVEFME